MDLDLAFQKHIQEENYFTQDSSLVLALSGGVDSMVLAHLLFNLPKNLQPKIILAHANHHLRPASDNEEAYIRDWAGDKPARLEVKHWENPSSKNIEQAARNFRYDFFKEVMEKYQADVLLTGHHQDDQLETILMNLTRGGRWESLQGIKRKRTFGPGYLIRPLLDFTKSDLRQYAVDKGIFYFEDQTNYSRAHTRNRFRLDIVPLLKKENPQVGSHAQELSENIQALQAIINPQVEAYLTMIEGDSFFSLKAFRTLPEAYQPFVLEAWLEKSLSDKEGKLGSLRLKDILAWLKKDHSNSAIDLFAGIRLVKAYDRLYLQQSSQEKDESLYTLTLNETVELSQREAVGYYSLDQTPQMKNGDQVIYLDPESIDLPLQIRHRQPGDRMSLKGMSGSKKIKDIFIDQKTPLSDRDKAWLIEDASGQIIWLVGYKESSLSIENETGTIYHVLLYRNKEN